MSQPIPESRGCSLSAQFGPAFNAEYQRLVRELWAAMDDIETAERVRNDTQDFLSGIFSATIFGALFTAFNEVLRDQENLGTRQAKQLAASRFGLAVRDLCNSYLGQQKDAAEELRWARVVKGLGGRPGPTWEQWEQMSEADRLKWVPDEAESMVALRARVASREARLERAREVFESRISPGVLVTTDAMPIKGRWMRL